MYAVVFLCKFGQNLPTGSGDRVQTRLICTVFIRATENRFFAGPDRFLVCKTDSVCIKRIFFGLKKKHTLRIIYWPNNLD